MGQGMERVIDEKLCMAETHRCKIGEPYNGKAVYKPLSESLERLSTNLRGGK